MTALNAKIPVKIYDPSQSVLDSGIKKFEGWLSKDVSKGRISKEVAEEARGLLIGCKGDGIAQGGVGDGGVDLVIEVSFILPPFLRISELSSFFYSNTSYWSL